MNPQSILLQISAIVQGAAGVQQLAQGLQSLSQAALQFGTSAVKASGEAEQTAASFEQMLGSTQKAKQFLQELATFAANTPFELKNLQTTALQMKSFGFETQQVVPLLTAVGDAAGGQADKIERITRALGQMRAKGKISAEEIGQLAEAGIPAWQMLADKIGISIPEAMKRAEQGTLSAAEGIPALLAGMTEKYGGMMARQSTTLLGMWSNFQDNLSQTMIQIGDQIVETFDLKGLLKTVNEQFTALRARFADFNLKQWAADNKDALMLVAGVLSGLLVGAAIAAAGALAALIAPALPIIAAGAAIGAALTALGLDFEDLRRMVTSVPQAFSQLRDNVTSSVEALKARTAPILANVKDAIRDALSVVRDVWQRVALPIWNDIQPIIRNVLNGVMPLLTGFSELVKGVFSAAKTVIQTVLIPAFEAIWPIVKNALSIVGTVIRAGMDYATGLFTAAGKLLQGDWKGAWDALVKMTGEMLVRLGAGLTGGIQKLADAGQQLGSKIRDAIMAPLLNLREVMIEKVLDAVNGMLGAIPQPILERLGLGNGVPKLGQALNDTRADQGDIQQRNAARDAVEKLDANTQAKLFFRAIFGQESGGNYRAINDRTGALGKYQVMPQHLVDNQYDPARNTRAWLEANWNNPGKPGQGWDYKNGGFQVTPKQFLDTPEIQEAIAQAQMAANLQKRLTEAGGNLEKAIKEAAKDWYGRGKVAPGEPTPDEYAESVYQRFLKASGTPIAPVAGRNGTPAAKDTGASTSTSPTSTANSFDGFGGTATAPTAADVGKSLAAKIESIQARLDIKLIGKDEAIRSLKVIEDQALVTARKSGKGWEEYAAAAKTARAAIDGIKKTGEGGVDVLQALSVQYEYAGKTGLPEYVKGLNAYIAAQDRAAKSAKAGSKEQLEAQANVNRARQLLKDSSGPKGDVVASAADLQKYSAAARQIASLEAAIPKSTDTEWVARAQARIAAYNAQGVAAQAVLRIVQGTSARQKELDNQAADDLKKLRADQETAAKTLTSLNRDQLQQRVNGQQAAEKEIARVRDVALKTAGNDAQARLGIEQNAAAALKQQAQNTATAQLLLAKRTAEEAYNTTISGIPEKASQAQVKAITEAAQKVKNGSLSAAYDTYYSNIGKAAEEGRDRVSAAQDALTATLQSGVDAGNAALASLDTVKLSGRELADAAQVLIPAQKTFDALYVRIVAMQGELAKPGVADAWAESITELGKRGRLTADQVGILKSVISGLGDIDANLKAFGGIRMDPETGKWLYQTEDQLRGIGVAADDTREDFFDLRNVIDGIGLFSASELDILITQSGLAEDAADQLREAWEKVYGTFGGPLELPDNLQGRGVQVEPGSLDPATGNLASGEAEVLLEAMVGMNPVELGGILAGLVAKGFGETPLAQLIQGELDRQASVQTLLADNFEGRGVKTEPDAFDPASGHLSDQEKKDLLERMAGADPEELGKLLAGLVAKGFGESDLGKLIRGFLQDEQNAIEDNLREFGGVSTRVSQTPDPDVVGDPPPTGGESVYQTDDELRGIGVAVTDLKEDFYDLDSVIQNVLGMSQEEMDGLLDSTDLSAESVDKVRDAWLKFNQARLDGIQHDDDIIALNTQLTDVMESLRTGAYTAEEARPVLKGIREELVALGGEDAQGLIKSIDEMVAGFDTLKGAGAELRTALGQTERPFQSLITSLEELRKKPGAAVVEIDALIKKLKGLQGQTEGLAKFNLIAGNVSQIAGAFGQLGDAIGGDLGANISGAMNALQKGVAIAQDIASGNWVGAITKVVAGIADAIAGFQKARAEVAKLKEDFNKQFTLIDASTFSSFTTRSRGFFADLFGGGPEVVKQVNETAATIAKAIEGGVLGGFQNGIKAFLNGTGTMLDAIREGVRGAIIDAITQAVIQGAIIKGALGSLLTELTNGLAAGTDVGGVIAQIGAALPGIARSLEQSLAPLKGVIDKALPASTSTASSTSNASFGSGSATFQAGTPAVVIDVLTQTRDLLKSANDVSRLQIEAARQMGGHIDRFGGFVDKLTGPHNSATAGAR